MTLLTVDSKFHDVLLTNWNSSVRWIG